MLGFNRAVKGIAKNETLEVVRIADKSMVVRNAVGEDAPHGGTGEVLRRIRTTVEVATGESVARSSMRKSASELARKAGTVFVRGACRGIKAARHFARRLSVREAGPVPAEISYQNEPRTERHRERGIGR